jgi:arginine:ornithine antiporter / lysine permease
LGNVSYWVLIKSTLNASFPVFGDGNTIPAILVASMGIWLFHFHDPAGVTQAAFINQIVTIAKIVPILVFIVILLVAFRGDVFRANFYGGERMLAASLFEQVRATMFVTVFVFLGIEGASVYSRDAKQRKDVGSATILGFIGVTCPDGARHPTSLRCAGADGHCRDAAAVDGDGVLESVVGLGEVFSSAPG